MHHHKSDEAVIDPARNRGCASRAIAAVMRQSIHRYGAPDREMADGFARGYFAQTESIGVPDLLYFIRITAIAKSCHGAES